MIQFKQATKQAAFIKLCITGASGAGKTMSAIRLAKGLVGEGALDSGKIGVIDTENGSASLYSDRYQFLTIDMQPPFQAEKFSEAIRAAEQSGLECVIIDSGSHLWEGVLDYKENLDKARSGANNSFTNWKEAGRKFKESIDTILQSKIHVIVCLRSKQEYVLEQDSRGKNVPKRVGMAPVFRNDAEFEFTVIFDINYTNSAIGTKDRTGLFPVDQPIVPHITEETGQKIRGWLTGNSPTQSPASTPQPTAPTAQSSNSSACSPAIDRLRELLAEIGTDDAKAFAWLKVNSWADVGEDLARQAIPKAEAKLASLKAQAQPAA